MKNVKENIKLIKLIEYDSKTVVLCGSDMEGKNLNNQPIAKTSKEYIIKNKEKIREVLKERFCADRIVFYAVDLNKIEDNTKSSILYSLSLVVDELPNIRNLM